MIITYRPFKYYYKAFDLVIESEIEMMELLSAETNAKADVSIFYGNSLRLPYNKKNNYYYDANKNIFKFDVDNVACYTVESGSFINIEPYEPYDLLSIKQYLLGIAMGALLGQRNLVALHSSSLVFKDKAILLCGECGAGKSTLSSALIEIGFGLLSDDISVVKTFNNKPMVYPSYPQQKLCGDAIKKMGYRTEDLLLIDEERDKYAVRVENFIDKPVELVGFYELAVVDCEEVKIRQVYGSEKLKRVINNIYYNFILDDIDLSQELLKNLLNIIVNVPFYHIDRPLNKDSISEIVDLIYKNFQVEKVV